MRIGILGGTFNPIHNAHLMLAENAYDELKLDKILFMPSGVSYLKNQIEIVSATQRIDMVKLAIKNNDHFELSTIETDRAGNTYTYVTLEEMRSYTNDDYFFIGGADILMNIENWKEPQRILNSCTLVIAPRDFLERDALIAKSKELTDKYNAKIILLNSANIDISSKMIRKRIEDDRSIKYYVPNEVEEYIYNNKLYK